MTLSALNKHGQLVPYQVDNYRKPVPKAHPYGYALILQNKRRDTRIKVPITTMGSLPVASLAFVYVARMRSGSLKLGMTTDPQKRAKNLRAEMEFILPVTHAAAKDVETHALRVLGQEIGAGEIVDRVLEDAIQAVIRAREIVSGYMHANPSLTEEQAKAERIAKRIENCA